MKTTWLRLGNFLTAQKPLRFSQISKYCVFVLLCLLLIPHFCVTAKAAKLDTSRQITGELARYTLDIPSSWKSYVSVYREDTGDNANYIEKLTFYYEPRSSGAAREVFIEIYVYEKDKWEDGSEEFITVAESDKYVMVYWRQSTNPFVFGSDRLIYDSLMEDASETAFFKDYISFPLNSDDFVHNVVTVNGKRVTLQAYVTSLRVVYVPLRETCEGLGYTVRWNESDSTVSVYSGSFFTELGYDLTIDKSFNIRNINGSAYVSTMFFLNSLECNVKIDGYNNVAITKQAVIAD